MYILVYYEADELCKFSDEELKVLREFYLSTKNIFEIKK